ncbi:tripartite tricarboxylate transporter substrate binding protein [Variovorax defluvii]|uniref:Tripartite tricarboxylate transporter substrate binding protein n=1 Tax=Variovorax defluvii TaxID=913761 RepID=A0ABP8ICM6_9BURK
MTNRRRFMLALAASALARTAPALAETFPNGPIKLVVPFPAGGTADFVARLAGDRLSAQLKVPVVIDNRVGANGNIATEAVARAPADGQTLLLGSTPNLTINPALYKKVNFGTLKDFAPITMLAQAPNVLVVHPSLGVNSVAELIAAAKARPGKILFASGGNGSTGHLAGEMLQHAAGIQLTHVPYRGGPQAVTDLIGGQVQMLFFTVPTVMPHVRAGKLKALAVSSLRRSPVLPDLPTVAESGIPGFDATPWFGLLAPAGTPRAVIDRISLEIAKAWGDEDIKAKLAGQGAEPWTTTPEQFTAQLKADLVRWPEAVKRSGATVD